MSHITKTDSNAHSPAHDSAPISASGATQGMQLRMIKLSDIVIPDSRHKRRSRRREDELDSSMDAIGLDSPISVSPAAEGKFVLVAGGGRLSRALQKGWTEIPAIVKERDAKARAASTAAENIAREDLSPAEEADALEHMIKAGFTPRHAARNAGLSPRTGTLRMALVEMPEELRAAFHHDGLPPSLAAAVKAIYDGNHAIGLEIGALTQEIPDHVAASLGEGRDYFFRRLPWLHREAKLPGDPPFLLGLRRGFEQGRTLSWDPKDRGRIRIKGKAAKWFIQRANAATWDYERPGIVLSEEDLDTASAIGVAYPSEGEHWTVWVHDREWLTTHINELVLPRMKADAEVKAGETSAKKLKGTGGKLDLTKASAQELAPALERRFRRELQPRAHAANLDLGRALMTKLAVKKLTREHALFFAYETLGHENAYPRASENSARRVAECAARVMEEWITVQTSTLKSGQTRSKILYLDGEAAERRMWAYIKGATTPEEILQRVLHMHAAAAVFRRQCGPNGREPHPQSPENPTAARALAKLLKPLVPASVKRIDRQLREYDATREAEEMIAAAKAEVAEPASDESAAPARPRSLAARALELIEAKPGITVPELATELEVPQNRLYRDLPALVRNGKVQKRGRGWHPVKAAPVAKAA